MSETQTDPSEIREIRALLKEFGVPFAKALAVFVRESAAGLHRTGLNAGDRHMGGGEDGPSGGVTLGPLQGIEELDPALRDELNAAIDAYESSASADAQETMEFTANSPVEAATHRLRRVAREQGVTQKELAARLNVTPAVISRVFKNPDRSRLATLRKIAQALDVELHEIV